MSFHNVLFTAPSLGSDEKVILIFQIKPISTGLCIAYSLHKKTRIMASSPITSRQIDEEKVETVVDFIFLGSKITEDGDCSHETNRHFLLLRKAMTNLDSILKSRDITLPTKVHIIQAMVFPVVMYWCQSWTIKESWAPKNWCFWTVVL